MVNTKHHLNASHRSRLQPATTLRLKKRLHHFETNVSKQRKMAPSRQSTTANKSRPTQRRGKNNNLNKDESQSTSSASEEKPFLLLEDVTCKICLNFMVRPVTLPCKHDLCYVCYENCVAKSNLACPMCRKRISVWCRQATKTNTVVNEVLWQRIQAQFPELVEAQNEGKDEKDTEDCEYLFCVC